MAGRPSKVDRLPPGLREGIAQLWHSGRYTVDQILAHLRELAEGRRSLLPPELASAAEAAGVAPADLPSRSRLHAHLQGLDAVAEKLQRSRTVAEALVKRLGDEPESRTARLNIELMHSAILDLFLASGGSPAGSSGGSSGGSEAAPDAAEAGAAVTLDAQQAMFVARALKDLAAARKADAELTVKLRQEMAARIDRSLKSIAAEQAPAGDPATARAALLRRIREEIYGIVGSTGGSGGGSGGAVGAVGERP